MTIVLLPFRSIDGLFAICVELFFHRRKLYQRYVLAGIKTPKILIGRSSRWAPPIYAASPGPRVDKRDVEIALPLFSAGVGVASARVRVTSFLPLQASRASALQSSSDAELTRLAPVAPDEKPVAKLGLRCARCVLEGRANA